MDLVFDTVSFRRYHWKIALKIKRNFKNQLLTFVVAC